MLMNYFDEQKFVEDKYNMKKLVKTFKRLPSDLLFKFLAIRMILIVVTQEEICSFNFRATQKDFMLDDE
jgi:hypothetical protein